MELQRSWLILRMFGCHCSVLRLVLLLLAEIPLLPETGTAILRSQLGRMLFRLRRTTKWWISVWEPRCDPQTMLSYKADGSVAAETVQRYLSSDAASGWDAQTKRLRVRL